MADDAAQGHHETDAVAKRSMGRSNLSVAREYENAALCIPFVFVRPTQAVVKRQW